MARELATYSRVVCAAPSFLARHGDIDSVAALAEALWRSSSGGGPAIAGSSRRPKGNSPITVDGPLCTNNLMIIRDAILAGVGVAWLPDYVIGDELRDGRLVRLLPEAKLPPTRVFGVMPKQARQNTTVRAVLDALGAGLRAQAARGADHRFPDA